MNAPLYGADGALEPCPFCGSHEEPQEAIILGATLVFCRTCFAVGPVVAGQSREQCRSKWNQRAHVLRSSPDPDLEAGAPHIGEIPRITDVFDGVDDLLGERAP